MPIVKRSRLEMELQDWVREQCDELRLIVQHYPDSLLAWERGWPDLMIIGPGGMLFRELKSVYGDLKPDQRRVGSWLMRAGQDWAVWRPMDKASGVITRQLEAISQASA